MRETSAEGYGGWVSAEGERRKNGIAVVLMGVAS